MGDVHEESVRGGTEDGRDEAGSRRTLSGWGGEDGRRSEAGGVH